MQVFKFFMWVLAYVGIGFIFLGIVGILWSAIYYIDSPASSWNEELVHEWTGVPMVLGWMISFPGAILALAGGIVSKPRHFWMVIISIGAIYCIAVILIVTTLYIKRQGTEAELSIGQFGSSIGYLIFPGLLCVIGGLIIRRLSRKHQVKA